jgi:hypothetical protein
MKFRKCNLLINVVKNLKFHEKWFTDCEDISAQSWRFKAWAVPNYKTWGLYRAPCDNAHA